ncbi:ABC transporter permease [Nocardia macrotermitis]|uniref:Riboflavin transport system permease protein RibX n=1 Tax=Nocardia macrotermitis TaxID=2585198 RepID=A0A7K0D5B6_9NOCA|nr:ABC transporter permease [Nocardia macrotermitis]MQY20929.1 Riboflavin transport system permease protein RibX [Nocardia macrotermitis]
MSTVLNVPIARTPEVAPAASRRLVARFGRGSVAVGALVAGIALWYAVSYLVLSPQRRFLLPAPHTVLSESLLDPVHLRPMLVALGETAQVAGMGFVAAAVIGIAVGALMSQTWWLERVIFPYAVVLQVVPILAITPLLGLWFGYSTTSRVAVCVMIALFPIITNTHFGFRSVDPGLHELFTLGRASRLQRLVRLELPAASPAILTGLRIASGQVIIGAIIGDMFFAQGQPGIGTLMDDYRAQLRSTDLIAAIVLAAAFGVVVFVVCSAVSRLAVGRWHGSGGAR